MQQERTQEEHVRNAQRWQKEVHFCAHCKLVIVDGSERAWTGAHDAPLGQYRYRCNQCDNASLCERCWDKFIAGDAKVHNLTHPFSHVPPVTTRHGAAGAASRETADNPWGAFRGSVSGSAYQRLYKRTGFM